MWMSMPIPNLQHKKSSKTVEYCAYLDRKIKSTFPTLNAIADLKPTQLNLAGFNLLKRAFFVAIKSTF